MFSGYWPHVSSGDEKPVAETLNATLHEAKTVERDAVLLTCTAAS